MPRPILKDGIREGLPISHFDNDESSKNDVTQMSYSSLGHEENNASVDETSLNETSLLSEQEDARKENALADYMPTKPIQPGPDSFDDDWLPSNQWPPEWYQIPRDNPEDVPEDRLPEPKDVFEDCFKEHEDAGQ